MKNRLYLVEDGGKYGFIDFEGNIIVPLIYNHVRNFNEGVAWVNLGGIKQNYDCIGGKWGFIDEEGKVIRKIDLELVNMGDFSEGLSWVMRGKNKYNGVWGIIDITGKWVLKPKHEFRLAHGFDNGISIVELNQKKGYVKNSGEILFEPQFDSVGGFDDGVSWVNIGAEEDYDGYLEGGKWALVNLNGEFIIDYEYENVQNFHDGTAWVCKDSENVKWGLIDKEGKQILDFQYEEVFRFHDNEALVKLNSKWIFIDPNGAIIRHLREDIQEIHSFQNNIAKIVLNGNFGFINRKGEIVLEPEYKEMRDSEFAAWVKSEDKWIIFNKESRKLIDLEIEVDSVENFINNEAKWIKSNKWGLVNKEGEILAQPKYDYIGNYRDGRLWVNIGGTWGYSGLRGGKWGLIDIEGNFIVEPIFDWIWYFWEGELLDANIGDKKGFVNWKGEIVWMK